MWLRFWRHNIYHNVSECEAATEYKTMVEHLGLENEDIIKKAMVMTQEMKVTASVTKAEACLMAILSKQTDRLNEKIRAELQEMRNNGAKPSSIQPYLYSICMDIVSGKQVNLE